MNTILKVGGIGIAEMILSEACTSADLRNCFFYDLTIHGHVSDQDDVAYVFDEDTKQYLAYKPVKDAQGQFVLLKDLKRDVESVGGGV